MKNRKSNLQPLTIKQDTFNRGFTSLSPNSRQSNNSPKKNTFFFPKLEGKTDTYTPKIKPSKDKQYKNSILSPQSDCFSQKSIRASNLKVKDGSPPKLSLFEKRNDFRGKSNTYKFNPNQKLQNKFPTEQKINLQGEGDVADILSLQYQIEEFWKNRDFLCKGIEKKRQIRIFFKEICQINIEEIEGQNCKVLSGVMDFIYQCFRSFKKEFQKENEPLKKENYEYLNQIVELRDRIEKLCQQNEKLCQQNQINQLEMQQLQNLQLLNDQLVEQRKLSQYEGIQNLEKQNQQILEKVNSLIENSNSTCETQNSKQNQEVLRVKQLDLIKLYEIQKQESSKSICRWEGVLYEYTENTRDQINMQNNNLKEQKNQVGQVWVSMKDIVQLFLLIKDIYKILNKEFARNYEKKIDDYCFQQQFQIYLEKLEEGVDELFSRQKQVENDSDVS